MSQAYIDAELRVSQAVDSFNRGEFTVIAKAARQYNADYDKVKRRLKGIGSKSERDATNMNLTYAEEHGICHWMIRSEQIRQRVTREMLEYEANTILATRPRPPNTLPQRVGDKWCRRFIKRYPKFTLSKETSQELDRQAAEDPEVLAAWYEEFAQVKAQNDIFDGDTYNYDETGIRLGVGKAQYVITTEKKKIRAGTTTSRESATICETISADGHSIPLLVILKGVNI